MWGRGQVPAHLSQPGMFSVWWLFQGIAKPLPLYPCSLSRLALPGEERGKNCQGPPTMLGAGEEFSNMTPISQMRRTS